MHGSSVLTVVLHSKWLFHASVHFCQVAPFELSSLRITLDAGTGPRARLLNGRNGMKPKWPFPFSKCKRRKRTNKTRHNRVAPALAISIASGRKENERIMASVSGHSDRSGEIKKNIKIKTHGRIKAFRIIYRCRHLSRQADRARWFAMSLLIVSSRGVSVSGRLLLTDPSEAVKRICGSSLKRTAPSVAAEN